ncbi:hypothetical protein CAOG_03721 [Capsaspora owczarzaki ATCC 30864]|uniref:LYR motif-containing protein 9 n=1 Tax=Capsaspora owczarzaki (strain ATCC 30864) TaxID=595528 RepID=A0A0D2VQB6_CAPO3|nr:hypothetical protein CAOG_03721 [Capsaspora owczarzaki ATCC 30864]KJE92822.1 hypothetical protein CAOG_003721 [Capsaspora owczarzaki ATCC 30864]|eukprot:XP_004363449.1 hypothetical protein CAOG_03721 [Capsaspora owczarzaki ATCC 30864]
MLCHLAAVSARWTAIARLPLLPAARFQGIATTATANATNNNNSNSYNTTTSKTPQQQQQQQQARDLYRYLVRLVRQLEDDDTRDHYLQTVQASFSGHKDESDPVRIRQIIAQARKDAQFYIKKYNLEDPDANLPKKH